MKTDIQIARETELKPIGDIASELGIDPEKIEPYGRYMAKVPIQLIDEEKVKQSRLILVTAISPTKAGIGKTTVSIGLTLGLNKIGKKAVVTLNRHDTDLNEEIDIVRKNCEDLGVGFAVNEAFLKGGEGAVELAQTVVDTIDKQQPLPIRFTYKEADCLEDKIEKVCKGIYGASAVEYTAKKKLESLHATFTDEDGVIAHYPVCIAKTQFSFTADSTRYGSPEGFAIRIRDIILNCGSEMIVAIAGDMLRMPGLPKSPQAERITIVDGEIEGLS